MTRIDLLYVTHLTCDSLYMGHDSYSLIVYDSFYMTRIYVEHDSYIYESDHMWHDSYIYGTWLIHLWWDHMWRGTLFKGHDPYSLSVYCHYTWLIYMWDMTHTFMSPISCEMTHHLWALTHIDSLYVTRLTCDTLYMGHDSWSCMVHVSFYMSHIYMRHDSYIYESDHMWHDSYIYGTWHIH